MNAIETKIPCTDYGKAYGAWAKYLVSVASNAKDGYGFVGEWCQRGAIETLYVGTIVLECAGFKNWNDQERGHQRLHLLWELTDDGWVELGRSHDRGWAHDLRTVAIAALEKNR